MKLTAPAQPAEPGPRLSVLAVVTRATSRGSEVLLVRRANPPQPGHWGFPGGKVNWGEGLCQAAIRELKEETAIDGANPVAFDRSEERRVGKECVSRCRSRGSPEH